MNSLLSELYRKHWNLMVQELKNQGLANPLLIYLKDEESYRNADLRVMIFGQETNGWEGELGQVKLEDLLVEYANFFGAGQCFVYGGHFWNAIKDFQKTIKELSGNKSVEFVWNDILKIGLNDNKGHPTSELISLQRKVFPVLTEEINILKPNAIIFFTGHNYDDYIRLEWADIVKTAIKDWDTRYLTKFNSKFLPENTFRTYHPYYLYLQGKQYYKEVKETICCNLLNL